jgi:FkbM family methyltransferase
MSCNYFILTKPQNKEITNNNTNQIIYLNNYKTYILPQNNIEYYINNGLFESNLIEWSRQFCSKDKIMLDIGAHTGTYAISLSDNCEQVFAFEPQKMTYYALCGSVALSNLKNINCLNIGLGSDEQAGIKDLFIVSNDGGGSTVINSNDSNKQQRVLAIEQITIKTLDSLNINNIGFIKMDVEDNELNVLKGSLDTLKNSNYPKILFESNKTNNENNNISNDLFNYLKDLQYNIIQISGFNNMFLATYKI